MHALTKLFHLFCKGFFRLYCPLSVVGREHLPSGSYILCSNHCSHMDTPVLMMATRLPFDRFGMIAAKDYFFDGKSSMSIFRYVINLIPINRKITRDSLDRDLANCAKFIRESQGNLIFYPEGTRSMTGNINTFKHGIGMMALKLGVPIVPAYIEGTYHALKKGWVLPRPRRIRVKLGAPIMPLATADHHYKEVTYRLECAIKHLQGVSHVT